MISPVIDAEAVRFGDAQLAGSHRTWFGIERRPAITALVARGGGECIYRVGGEAIREGDRSLQLGEGAAGLAADFGEEPLSHDRRNSSRG